MRKVFLFISAAALLLAGCQKEQLVDNRAYNGPVTVVGATFENFIDDGATKAAVTDAGVFTWQNGDQAAFAVSDQSASYRQGENSSTTADGQFEILGEPVPVFTVGSFAIYPYDLTTGQNPTALKVTVPASRVWQEGQTNVAMYAQYDGNGKFNFNHMGGLVRVKVNNVPVGATKFVFETPGKKITGEFEVSTTSGGEYKVINTPDSEIENTTYTLTFPAIENANIDMVFYVPLPVGTYSGGFSFSFQKENGDKLYEKVGTTSQAVARRQLLLMPTITLTGGTIESGESASVQNIPAGYKGDFLLAESANVLVKIAAETATNNINLKYNTTKPQNLEIQVVGEGDDAGTFAGTVSGDLPDTHVEFTKGTIANVTMTTSATTLKVIHPASISSKLTVTGGNVAIKGAIVQAIEVAANAVADATTQAPVQIVMEKQGDNAPAVTDKITANADVVVAPESGVTVKVDAAENVKVAKDGEGTVKDGSGNPISTKAVAQIGEAKYITLADAIAAVKNDETISIIENKISATAIPTGSKKFTIDLGNKEVTVDGPAVGSSQTMNQAFQINRGNTITIKNGTIKCENSNNIFRFVIQNYADLTLEDVTVDGTNLKKEGRTDAYTVSGNSGNIKFTGNTTVKASTVSEVDAYAIDLYDYTKNGYTQPAAGVWESDGSIIGAITLGGGSLTVSKELKLTKPMKAYKGDNGTVNLTVNANIIPGDNFDGDALVIVKRNADLTIDGSAKISNNSKNVYCAVKMTEPADATDKTNWAKLTVKDQVTLEGQQAGISGNGNEGRGNTEVTIEGSATIKGCATTGDECCGIYQPQNGKLTIKGGTIEGLVGVYVKSGTVETAVSGGTIKGTGAKGTYSPKGDGFKNTGDAIVFDNCGYPGGEPNATINGGTFISANGDAVASYAKEGKTPITGFIHDGTFSDESALKYAADNADINIALQANRDASGIFLGENKNVEVTFDLGGKTLNFVAPAVGSTGTENQAFHIEQGNQLFTLKNGKVTIDGNAKTAFRFIIQNYNNLTVEDVELDGTNLAYSVNDKTRYTVSNNQGTINFTGSTSIKAAAENGIAFDVCKNGDYTAPTVTWASTGSVTGNIELTGGKLVIASNLAYANTIMATAGTSNLEVNATLSATNASDWYLVKAGKEGKSGVVLNISGTGTLSSGTSVHCIPVTSDYGAQVYISGGNYICYGVNTNTPDGGECVYANREGKVSISGGTFGVREGDTVKDLLNVQNDQQVTDIQCTGGTFYGKNPADGDDAKEGSFVASGYVSTETAEGSKIWTVSEQN